ncbi:MAG: ribosome maturation factor RimP [Saprospiraceae bacterium]|jgi:ribosome maturation factor RimP
MISEEKVRSLVEEKIAETDKFIVEVKIHSGNKIVVLIDAYDGIAIEDCSGVSKYIEASFDREKEDFEIEVSSAGLEAPFLVAEQYKKSLGKTVKVITEEGKKVEGVLAEISEDGIVLKYEEKQRVEGRRKRVMVQIEKKLYFDGQDKESNIKTTKIVISFK